MRRRRRVRTLGLVLAAGVLALAVACDDPALDRDDAVTARARSTEGERDALRRFWDTYRAATRARSTGLAATAIDLYREALEIDPEHGDSLHYLAQLLQSRGDVAGAHDLLRRLTRAESHSLRGWQQLSVLQGSPAPGWVADPEAALESILRATEWNPSNSGAQALRARWAAQAGHMQEARRALTAALELNPDNAEALAVESWLARPMHEGGGRLHVADGTTLSGELRVDVDLDGDGVADLRAAAPGRAMPAALGTVERGEGVELPADRPASAWSASTAGGPRPTVWRGAFLHGPSGDRLLLVGGGPEPVRLYAPTDHPGAWRQAPGTGLPSQLYGAVLATADVDGDGFTDVLLGNLPGSADGDGGSGGREDGSGLWLARSGGRFIRAPVDLPAARAALLADLDGDGGVDLILARRDRASPATGDATEDPGPPLPSLTLYRNAGAGLEPWTSPRVPPAAEKVTDLWLLRGDDAVELLVATGGLTPGADAPDHLWRWDGSGFVDADERLGPRATGSTVRILPGPGGSLRLLRGGLVPGDPRTVLILDPH